MNVEKREIERYNDQLLLDFFSRFFSVSHRVPPSFCNRMDVQKITRDSFTFFGTMRLTGAF